MRKYLYFSAAWCGPCQSLAPIMEEVNNSVPVQKVDVDTESELAAEYNIRSVPTVVLLIEDKPVRRYVGVQSLQTYLDAAGV